MDQTELSFMIFLSYPSFRKPGKQQDLRDVHYGSSMDNAVHSVQMDNLVHKDNPGWNNKTYQVLYIVGT